MKFVETPGKFYLGKIVDPSKKKETSETPLLYDSKNLTTHAVCVGMTGSGKTGLCIDILEEAALNKIPAIIIDPKGDLGNLLLTFPDLSPNEFLPWIDESEASRKGMQPNSYAETIAKTWKEGLEKWGESPERVQNLRNSTSMVIYTPASKAGIPVSILSSFAAPTKEIMQDEEALRDRILSITSSLLGLLGIDADPVKSREHILISTIIAKAWEKGTDLNIATLIQQIQKPPFETIGALDTDTFFPPKDRLALSISLNGLLASPGFQAWMEGEPLDIQQIFFTKEGKPKLSIFSIAHLSSSERMFFVTILLNELLSWMRRQPGTSNLRSLLYMDEIFGFFPPSAMPPSKIPMLTLLKQARAFGLGVILATQNPVDLDYKGLSNCGTWFIGKLQTERDKARVLEGLQAASNGEIDAKTLDKMIAQTGNRIFIMRSIYEKAPILFETRWTMSYLRGPLTLAQIGKLKPTFESSFSDTKVETVKSSDGSAKPIVPPGIPEFFGNPQASKAVNYHPLVAGIGKVHFVDSKNKIDSWQDFKIVAPASDDGSSINWEQGKLFHNEELQLDNTPVPGSSFKELPSGLMKKKNYDEFQKSLSAYIYQNQEITLYQSQDLKLISKPDQSEDEFRKNLSSVLLERRTEAIQKIRSQYEDKIAQVSDKLKRAQEKATEKQQKASWQKIDTGLSFLTSILDAVLGRKITKGTISKAGTSIRRAGKMSQDSQDVMRAEDECAMYQQQLDDLRMELNNEVTRLESSMDPNSIPLQSIIIRPRKGDILIEKVALVWWP